WEYCDVSPCSGKQLEATKETPTDPPTDPPEIFQTCGQPEVRRTLKKIYGGSKATAGKHSWMASLQKPDPYANSSWEHFCGRVLIKSCLVLTAAHCLDNSQTKIQVALGKQNLENTEDRAQIFDAVHIILHGKYRDESYALYNDIALLKLQPVDGHCALETKFVKKACLPDFCLPVGTSCLISGRGETRQV
ncbi:HABP2 protein, partial [Phainopepla nitens]|nr:HABP2 protein [Phainopepla nitens]